MIKLLKIAIISFYILSTTDNLQSEKYHLVKSGETLYSISKLYGISVEKLKNLNSLSDNSLSVGQKIIIQETIIQEKVDNNITNREEAFASTIDGMDDSDKYLALHKTAEIGTIIFVKNQMNDAIVIVRVIGKLPDTGINQKVDIKLSKIAFDKLSSQDLIVPVELTYVGKDPK